MADKAAQKLMGALVAPPVPNRGPDIVKYAGSRRAAVQAITGLDRRPTKADYPDAGELKAARRRWDTASRRVQRWSTEAGEKRGQGARPVKLNTDQAGRLRSAATGARVARYRKAGMRARLIVRLKVNTTSARKKADVRTREIPSGGPGVFIPAEQADEILDGMREAGPDEAAEWFLDAALEAYGIPGDVEVEDVESVKVWPEGTPEP